MNTTLRLLRPALTGFLLAALPAQSLELDVTGGSMPGTLLLDAYPAVYPFELMAIVPSSNPGPTPIQLFDPNDLRSLSIGLDMVPFAWPVLADLSLHATVQVPISLQPSLVDVPLYFQAVTFLWQPTLLDRLSNGNVVRFGLGGAFRDRAVTMQEQRAFSTALVRPDRRTLVVGGARGQLLAQVATATTDLYDPISDTFSYGPLMTTPRSMHTMTQLADGRYLLCGGVNATNDPQASCEIYDPVSDTFTAVAPMGTARMGHTANLLPNGLVLVTGGIEAMPVTPTQLEPIHNTVASTELYDPTTDTWSAGPNLSTPRAAHAAIVRPDGKILFAGGISWDSILFTWLPAVRTSCDLYDPVANTMSAGPSMATARALADPIQIAPDRWLLAGGMNGLSIIPWNPGNPTAAAEVYDATTNTWTSVGSMATARANHMGFALGNGRFLIAGGGDNSILSPTPLSSTEIFDTQTNSFSPGPAMSTGRAGASFVFAHQGQVQVFGGAATSTTITSGTEWYYF